MLWDVCSGNIIPTKISENGGEKGNIDEFSHFSASLGKVGKSFEKQKEKLRKVGKTARNLLWEKLEKLATEAFLVETVAYLGGNSSLFG